MGFGKLTPTQDNFIALNFFFDFVAMVKTKKRNKEPLSLIVDTIQARLTIIEWDLDNVGQARTS